MAIPNTCLALLVSLSALQIVSGQSDCDPAALNTTVGSWPVTSTDTIFSIASTTKRSVCAIARANRMGDATLMVAGETLLIPAQTCDAIADDNTSCLIPTNATYTENCISGGLHTYNTRLNDTRATIAAKFRISLDSITVLGNTSVAPDVILEADSQLKIPQCSPSSCNVMPYKFVYGTYVDLAAQFNTTVGQIMAFNPTYNYSSTTDSTEGPVISLPMNCTNLSANVTVIS